jgi:hypothetical protein
MTINDAIKIMKSEVKDKYALGYLNNLPRVIDEGGAKGLCVQMKYILENLKTWRGETAKETKAFIKQWIKEREKTLDE